MLRVIVFGFYGTSLFHVFPGSFSVVISQIVCFGVEGCRVYFV